jgi:hypothetical protein
MSIHVALHHRTSYRYKRPISLGPQVVRLRPAPYSRTRILSYSLKVTPEQHFLNWQQDPQSNYLARLVFEKKTTEFTVEVDLVAEMAVFNPFDYFLEPAAENFPFDYDAALDQELAPFLRCIDLTPKFTDYYTSVEKELLAMKPWPPRTNDVLVAINGDIVSGASDVRNKIGLLPVGASISFEIFREGKKQKLETKVSSRKAFTATAMVAPENQRLEGIKFGNLDSNSPYYGVIEGVQVSEIDQNSLAWRSGLRQGDVITSVNREPVASAENFFELLGQYDGPLLLRIVRGDSAAFLVIR